MSAPKPEKILDEVAAFIAESRALIDKGAFLELDGLDEQVKQLCDMVMGLSKEQRMQCADKMEVLVQELNALAAELTVQREAVASEIRGLGEHRKAHVAYSAADATDAFGKKKDDHGNG